MTELPGYLRVNQGPNRRQRRFDTRRAKSIVTIFYGRGGLDTNPGTRERPLLTSKAADRMARVECDDAKRRGKRGAIHIMGLDRRDTARELDEWEQHDRGSVD